MILEYTTAVDDIERKAPTNIPSVSLPPHNCNEETAKVETCKPLLQKILILKQKGEKSDQTYISSPCRPQFVDQFAMCVSLDACYFEKLEKDGSICAVNPLNDLERKKDSSTIVSPTCSNHIKHKDRVLGLILISPQRKAPSWSEWAYYKEARVSYDVCIHLLGERHVISLRLLLEAINRRHDITDGLRSLKCRTLISFPL
ncbi:hypothetical protein YC2023_088558 [Brassica napus]